MKESKNNCIAWHVHYCAQQFIQADALTARRLIYALGAINGGVYVKFGFLQFLTLSLITVLAQPAHGQTRQIPPHIKKTMGCMLRVLKTVPGVSNPRMHIVTTGDVTQSFIEYRATEATRWVQPTRFILHKTSDGGIWFLATLPGILPPGGSLDLHVTDAVMKKWKAQCGVDANVITV